MSNGFFGTICFYGNDQVIDVLHEAQRRLEAASKSTSHFDVDTIRSVFLGPRKDDDDKDMIGARGLEFEEIRFQDPSPGRPRCTIFFGTDHSYPDYLSEYLYKRLRTVDKKVLIKLECRGEDGEKVLEWFSY